MPQQHIINLSLESSVVPNQMKIAKVVPLFKNGDPLSMDNYRPISLLSSFSKILEKIVANRLCKYLETKIYSQTLSLALDLDIPLSIP